MGAIKKAGFTIGGATLLGGIGAIAGAAIGMDVESLIADAETLAPEMEATIESSVHFDDIDGILDAAEAAQDKLNNLDPTTHTEFQSQLNTVATNLQNGDYASLNLPPLTDGVIADAGLTAQEVEAYGLFSDLAASQGETIGNIYENVLNGGKIGLASGAAGAVAGGVGGYALARDKKPTGKWTEHVQRRREEAPHITR